MSLPRISLKKTSKTCNKGFVFFILHYRLPFGNFAKSCIVSCIVDFGNSVGFGSLGSVVGFGSLDSVAVADIAVEAGSLGFDSAAVVAVAAAVDIVADIVVAGSFAFGSIVAVGLVVGNVVGVG